MMSLLDPQISERIGRLQALDDAIAFRAGRLAASCPGCAGGARCAEHARDERLIADCQRMQAATFDGVLQVMDPDDVAQVMRPGDGLPPAAAAASLALLAGLRRAAAAGPVLVELDDGLCLVELDGAVVVVHPLPPGAGNGPEAT